MNKEVISDYKAISIIILFLTGSTSIFVSGLEAKKDLWLAIVLAIFMVIPMVIIYARLHYIFPGKDLFDIIEICFGKFIGKIIMIVVTWYLFYWTADVLNNYGQFIRVVSLTETPQIILMIMLLILCVWSIKEGIEVLGRWSEFFLIIFIVSIFVTITLLIPDMNLNNIRPVLYEGVKPIFKGAFSVFSQPLVQAVAFTMVFASFKRKKSPYKVYLTGLLIGGILTLMISLINILVVGANHAKSTYYPSYYTVAMIDIGDIFQRIEVVIATTFVLGGFIKISVLLLGTCKGITKIFGYKDYRFIIIPISLLLMNFSYFQYESVMYYFEFNSEIWPYYFFPFQVIFPIIIWITAEIKKKRLTNSTI